MSQTLQFFKPIFISLGGLKNQDSTDCMKKAKTRKFNEALGIHFSCDQEQVMKQNFQDRLNEVQKMINLWKLRGLSLFGKVTIIKSFLIPKLLCVFNINRNPTRNY